ncbi:MAG: hypothetical protein QXG00_08165 [Candidatus Woesearchaeota archaeon]
MLKNNKFKKYIVSFFIIVVIGLITIPLIRYINNKKAPVSNEITKSIESEKEFQEKLNKANELVKKIKEKNPQIKLKSINNKTIDQYIEYLEKTYAEME